ncbi:ESX secretion-associated protein EspG [Actinokineospora terrae]|uniref:EspG family protein n=1 Tax=Actinokineospora terrae TaxID=155974 RepID=A0A1H9SDW6_9PSEU|nr:ESX secretion-associated protein EspG [Actinokineospora terrae]SER82379.1 EspG family protein [Actinokineospora terrae]
MTVTALEFDVLAEHLGVASVPLVLSVPSPGRTDTERAGLVERAWRGLAARGLGAPGQVDPLLASLIGLLDRPDREVDGRLWTDGPLRVLAAARADSAVLATMSPDAVTLRPADASGLPRYALPVLPAVAAGPGRSVTVPTADFEAAAPGPLAAGLRARGIRPDDATTLAEMITPLHGHGQFGAATRDHWGTRHRTDRVVSYFDTAHGRYLQTRTTTPTGESWTTISPADTRRLHHHIAELLPA